MNLTHVLVFAIAMFASSGCNREQPKSDLPPVSVPRFDGERAFSFLTKQTEFGPRNPNSRGHAQCLSYLTNTLRAVAETVRIQEFTEPGYGQEQLHLTNIIASFRPQASQRVLLCAHWDTRPRAERDPDPRRRDEPILGANDGASGVAVLLEIAHLLKSTPPPVGVDIVLFDGEDYGKEGDLPRYFLGARYFALNKSADYVPRFGVLLDMVGDAELQLPQEINSLRWAPDVVSEIWTTARALGETAFTDQPGDQISDDHVPLNEAGIKTIDIIDFAYPDQSHIYWHTHQDTPEHCSAASLQSVGTVLTHVVFNQKP
jgi:glutaminyl-peptide cyclotransferase